MFNLLPTSSKPALHTISMSKTVSTWPINRNPKNYWHISFLKNSLEERWKTNKGPRSELDINKSSLKREKNLDLKKFKEKHACRL